MGYVSARNDVQQVHFIPFLYYMSSPIDEMGYHLESLMQLSHSFQFNKAHFPSPFHFKIFLLISPKILYNFNHFNKTKHGKRPRFVVMSDFGLSFRWRPNQGSSRPGLQLGIAIDSPTAAEHCCEALERQRIQKSEAFWSWSWGSIGSCKFWYSSYGWHSQWTLGASFKQRQ